MKLQKEDVLELKKKDFDEFIFFNILKTQKESWNNRIHSIMFLAGVIIFALGDGFLLPLAGLGITVYSLVIIFKEKKQMEITAEELEQEYFEIKPKTKSKK